jgi:hypothetical protein
MSELFGQGKNKKFGPLQQGLLESFNSGERARVRKPAGIVDGFAVLKCAPAAGGVEIFQRKSDGSIRL